MVEARGIEAKSEPHYSERADAGERSARFSGTKAMVPGNGFNVAGPAPASTLDSGHSGSVAADGPVDADRRSDRTRGRCLVDMWIITGRVAARSALRGA